MRRNLIFAALVVLTLLFVYLSRRDARPRRFCCFSEPRLYVYASGAYGWERDRYLSNHCPPWHDARPAEECEP